MRNLSSFRPRVLLLVVLAFTVALWPRPVRAYPGPTNLNSSAGAGYVTTGVIGGVNFTCTGCHFGAANPPSGLSINGGGLGTVSVPNNAVATLSFGFQVGAGKPFGGFLIAHNDGTTGNGGGTLGAADGGEHACAPADGFPCNGTSNNNTEVMHAIPRGNAGGTVSWPFTYTPVANSCGTFGFNVWVNNVNGDSACNDANDVPTKSSFSIDVTCPASSDPCKANTCNFATGTCQTTLLTGNGCNDGNACTFNDTCTAGVCGGTALTCTSDSCNTRGCNGSSSCSVTPLSGGGCDDGQSCTINDVCSAGACNGTPTGSCASGRPLGSACTSAAQCASNICVDGTCCNNACTGQCEACNLPPTKGTCSPATGVPVAPRATCAGDGTACSGACNGALTTACTFPPASKLCRAASCANDLGSLATNCDGKGACPAARTQGCAPYVCGVNACDTTCTANAQCNAGFYCATGKCTPLVAKSGACTSDGQCKTGSCVDGVCCDTKCTGQCEACNITGNAGTCSPLVNAAPHAPKPKCGSDGTACGGTCDGTSRDACVYPGPTVECRAPECSDAVATVGAQCKGTGTCPKIETLACGKGCVGSKCGNDCVTSEQCNRNQFCQAGVCVPQHAAGDACTDASECLSSYCVDGVCCSSSCNGQCEACDTTDDPGACVPVTGVPHGDRPGCAGAGQSCGGQCDGTKTTACTYPGATKVCAAGKCAVDVATLPRVCSGAGTCGPIQEQLCSPSPCGAIQCNGNCTTDVACGKGNYCSAGICRPQNPLGAPCAAPDQCTSGFCIDGLCCNQACDGECEACDNPMTTGQCAPITGAPHGARPPCGGSGVCAGACDGKGTDACVFPGQNALCGVAGCGDGVIATAPTCNGIGNCVASSAISDCYPYACTSDGPACLTKCTTNDDCSAGARCVDEKCITPLDTDGGTPVDAGVGGPDGSVTPGAGGGTSTGTGGASGAAGNRGTGGGHAGSSNGPDAGLLADGAVPPDSGQVSGHKSGSGSGCGCRVAGNTDDDDRPLALGLVALGAVALRRARRKR